MKVFSKCYVSKWGLRLGTSARQSASAYPWGTIRKRSSDTHHFGVNKSTLTHYFVAFVYLVKRLVADAALGAHESLPFCVDSRVNGFFCI